MNATPPADVRAAAHAIHEFANQTDHSVSYEEIPDVLARLLFAGETLARYVTSTPPCGRCGGSGRLSIGPTDDPKWLITCSDCATAKGG